MTITIEKNIGEDGLDKIKWIFYIDDYLRVKLKRVVYLQRKTKRHNWREVHIFSKERVFSNNHFPLDNAPDYSEKDLLLEIMRNIKIKNGE